MSQYSPVWFISGKLGEEMEISSEQFDDILEVRLIGELDAENVSLLAEFLDRGPGREYTRFVFDLSRLDYIDSSGLGAFVKRMKEARQKGGDLKIATPGEDVSKVFELTRLDRVFDIRKTSEEAREQFYTVS